MVLYKPNVPNDYEAKRDLGNYIAGIILSEKLPKPVPRIDHISTVFGESAVIPYAIMHAIFHSMEYGRNRQVFEPKRRDEKALQIHSYDTVFRSINRLFDPIYPSGYLLEEPIQVAWGFTHDIPEEHGESLLGALVDIDCLDCLLADEFGDSYNKGINLLTNTPALLLDSDQRINNLLHRFGPLVKEGQVYDLLSRRIHEGGNLDGNIPKKYKKFQTALNKFEFYVRKEEVGLSKPQKDDWLDVLEEISNRLEPKIKNEEFLEVDYVKKAFVENYEHIMKIIKNRGYIEVDEDLLLPTESKVLITLKKTLYNDFIHNLAEEGKNDAGLFVVKQADSTESVAKMSLRDKPQHIFSIVRKGRLTTRGGMYLAKYYESLVSELRKSGAEESVLEKAYGDYGTLYAATNSLIINLDGAVNEILSQLETSNLRDNTWQNEIKRLIIIANKMDEMKSELSEMGLEVNGNGVKSIDTLVWPS